MTLKEYADRMWKEQYGDKTYEQVTAEYYQDRRKAYLAAAVPMKYTPSEQFMRVERLRAKYRRRQLNRIVARYMGIMLVCYAIVALAVALWYD